MMLDLFSSLDFQFSKLLSFGGLVWGNGLVWSIIIMFSFFFVPKFVVLVKRTVRKFFFKVFEAPLKNIFRNSFQLVYLFSFLIIFVKFWSMGPYIYGMATKLVFGLSMAFRVWAALKLSSLENSFNVFIRHFVSLGSPLGLGFALTYIEVVRSVIRPFTLTLRLVIKISIGHVIFRVLGTAGSRFIFSRAIVALLLLFVLIFFFIIETFVKLIQSSVFGLLLVKYFKEHTI